MNSAPEHEDISGSSRHFELEHLLEVWQASPLGRYALGTQYIGKWVGSKSYLDVGDKDKYIYSQPQGIKTHISQYTE